MNGATGATGVGVLQGATGGVGPAGASGSPGANGANGSADLPEQTVPLVLRVQLELQAHRDHLDLLDSLAQVPVLMAPLD